RERAEAGLPPLLHLQHRYDRQRRSAEEVSRQSHTAEARKTLRASAVRRHCQCLVPGEDTPTLICRGLVSAFLGRKTRRTPSLLSAVMCSTSTVLGSVKVRLNAPKVRSMRWYPS